ncbi:hypothetical protein CEXT_373201 [Caerostris extrusa]|uniref:Uncharacterized protein n=1 Tax=Caerostris extrusa TaxID=172846 RepID=A0AAV4UBM4_CAEEX|nr:hypothetical protein CEXT_373201 [Caerostris extrusa]
MKTEYGEHSHSITSEIFESESFKDDPRPSQSHLVITDTLNEIDQVILRNRRRTIKHVSEEVCENRFCDESWCYHYQPESEKTKPTVEISQLPTAKEVQDDTE